LESYRSYFNKSKTIIYLWLCFTTITSITTKQTITSHLNVLNTDNKNKQSPLISTYWTQTTKTNNYLSSQRIEHRQQNKQSPLISTYWTQITKTNYYLSSQRIEHRQQNVEMGGDCLFCWYWCNCWPSTFDISYHNIRSCCKYMILLIFSGYINLLVRFCFYNETAFSNSIIFFGKLSFIF
jgi:hypothetical protein